MRWFNLSNLGGSKLVSIFHLNINILCIVYTIYLFYTQCQFYHIGNNANSAVPLPMPEMNVFWAIKMGLTSKVFDHILLLLMSLEYLIFIHVYRLKPLLPQLTTKQSS